MPATGDSARRDAEGLRLGPALAPLAVAWAVVMARVPLGDNSFFTHLATGRLILERGSVPDADPYSFTAPGEPWTVQSWLPSLAYAGAERLAGGTGLRLLVLAVFVGCVLLLLALTQPARALLPRLALMAAALTVAAGLWSARPYMIAVAGVSIVWLALEGRVRPWLLLPLVWLWANSHGSFPYAAALVVAVALGRAADGERPEHELRVLAWTVGGTAAAVVSPLLLRGVTFPIRSMSRIDDLRAIREWQAPTFTKVWELVFLALAGAAIAGLVRRPSWRRALPVLLFVALALTALRNIVVAVPVLVAVAAATLGDLGSLSVDDRPRLARPLAVVSALALLLALVALTAGPIVDLDGYPQRQLAWLDIVDADGRVGRVAHQDFTGNLLEVLDGAGAEVFVDDRLDMYPSAIVDDERTLLDAGRGWSAVLDRWRIDAIVWEREQPLTAALVESAEWRIVHTDGDWVLACRRRGGACDALQP